MLCPKNLHTSIERVGRNSVSKYFRNFYGNGVVKIQQKEINICVIGYVYYGFVNPMEFEISVVKKVIQKLVTILAKLKKIISHHPLNFMS